MPVRCWIHSSEVSIHCVRSSFVTRRSGTYLPVPLITPLLPPISAAHRKSGDVRSTMRLLRERTLSTRPPSTHLPDPLNMETVRVRSAGEMAAAVLERSDRVDIVIKAAAVSDYCPVKAAAAKIKKDKDELRLTLKKNQDILSTLGKKKKKQVLIGFAAETEDLKKNAVKKLKEKNCDIIVGNLVGNPDSGFASDTNQVTFFYKDGGVESLDVMEKESVARILLDRIKERFFSKLSSPRK